MKKLLLPLALILSSRACTQVVLTPTPTAPAPAPTATVTPTAQPTATAFPTAAAEVDRATIRATVYVRQQADANSAEVGSLETGQSVEIVECDGSWCEIVPLPEWNTEHAFVFRGCTSNNPDGLACEVRQ